MSRRSVSSFIALTGALACALSAAEVSQTLPVEGGDVPPIHHPLVHSLLDRYREAVVPVEAVDKEGPLRGTGFFIDPNGTLLTSFSVGGESRDIQVVRGDRKVSAHRIGGEPRSGIAILKLDEVVAPTPFVPLARESSVLAVAAPVVTLGYPVDRPMGSSLGQVAGFNLKYQDRYFAVQHIRASIAVHRGEGGAPLLNQQGEAVGVVISSLEGGASCFALPIEAAQKVHRDFIRFGAFTPGRLGLVLREALKPVEGSTVMVGRLDDHAPAMKAGIQKGDILLKIGPNVIRAPEDVQNASFYLTPGEAVSVTLFRPGRKGEGKESGGVIALSVEPGPPSAQERQAELHPASASSGAPVSPLQDATFRLP
jgi:serine protease Do